MRRKEVCNQSAFMRREIVSVAPPVGAAAAHACATLAPPSYG
jgi:hypothetical protein